MRIFKGSAEDGSAKVFDWLVYCMLFLLPLFYLPDITLHFELPKIVLFRIFLLLMLFFTVFRVLKSGQIEIFSIFQKSLVKKLLFGFLIILVIGVGFSIAPRVSFWGSYYRMQGAYMWLHYFLFFLLLCLNFHSREQWRKAFKAIFVGFIFSFVLALIQLFDLPFFRQEAWSEFPDRAFAGFESPSYFAYYILLVIFPCLSVKKKSFRRILFIMAITAIILTQNRAALLGLIMGLSFYAIVYSIYFRGKKWLIFGILLPLIFAAFFFINNKLSLQNRFLLEGENLTSIETRLKIWRDVVPMLNDRPLFGYGLQTFQLAFEDYADEGLFDLENGVDVPDKAHNNLIEIMANLGVAGLTYFLVTLFMVFYMGLRALAKLKDPKRSSMLAILATFFAIFVADLFGFLLTAHYVFLSFLLAYFFYLLSERMVSKKLYLGKFTSLALKTFFTIFVLAAIVFQNIFFVIADFYANKGIAALGKNDVNGIIENFSIATMLMPQQSYYNYFLASVMFEAGDLARAREFLEKGARFDSFQDDFYQILPRGK